MPDSRGEKLWTPANKVTLARILAIPLFILVIVSPWPQYVPQWPEAEDWKPIIAALVFVVISATDAIDGHLARSRGEVTTLGKFMDPLADKILVAAALLSLVELQVLPSWVALIILAREFIVSGIRMVAASEGVVMPASWWGKVKTVTQIIAVVLFLVKISPLIGGISRDISDWFYLLAWASMLIALFFTIVSMLDYFSKASALLGFSSEKDEDAPDDADATQGQLSADGTRGVIDSSAEDSQLYELADSVVNAARAAGKTIGTAESCTGGLIGAALTAVPGSSDVVVGGIISYSNEVKESNLNVPADTLAEFGAVSRETACAMAEGAARTLHCDIAVSVTGIAGPSGAVPGKPVGTVWIGSHNGTSNAEEYHFTGTRSQIRVETVKTTLRTLLDLLSE